MEPNVAVSHIIILVRSHYLIVKRLASPKIVIDKNVNIFFFKQRQGGCIIVTFIAGNYSLCNAEQMQCIQDTKGTFYTVTFPDLDIAMVLFI